MFCTRSFLNHALISKSPFLIVNKGPSAFLLLQDIAARHGVPQLDPQSLQDLRAACETAKRKLSSMAEVTVSVYLSRYNVQYKASVTRARFEDLCADLFASVKDLMQGALAAAQVLRALLCTLANASLRTFSLFCLLAPN